MKTIGEVITFVEMINKASKWDLIRVHEAASDRWSISVRYIGSEKWVTLVTGRDPLDCWSRWEYNQRLNMQNKVNGANLFNFPALLQYKQINN